MSVTPVTEFGDCVGGRMPALDIPRAVGKSPLILASSFSPREVYPCDLSVHCVPQRYTHMPRLPDVWYPTP